MPCSCQIPIPNYPETVEWGPLFWQLLHALAERAGLQRDAFVQEDELRDWLRFLTAVGDVIPCPNCREHYAEWIQAHPLTQLKTLPYTSLREWIRRWLFDLHNSINERNGKPLFSYDALTPTYGVFDFYHGYYRLYPPLNAAMKLAGISYLKLQAWTLAFRKLESYIV